MNAPPILRNGSMLVVFDGPRRLLWSATAPQRHSLIGLWPAPGQADEVLDHLAAGGNVLVLLEQEQIAVPMFTDEAGRLPAELAARFAVTTDGVLSELRFAALDWLPEHLRGRGLRFLEDTDRLLSEQPDFLLPPLLVEDAADGPPNLRFARLRNVRRLDQEHIPALGEQLFTRASALSDAPRSAWEVSS